MKALLILLSLLLCACAPEKNTVIVPDGYYLNLVPVQRHHDAPPPGCQIVEVEQNNGRFYCVQVGAYSLAPYALYDTRQGAINCAWNCYSPDTRPDRSGP